MAALQSVPIWQFDLLNGLVVALRPGYGRRPNMTCGMLAETSAFKLNRQIVPAHQHNHAEITMSLFLALRCMDFPKFLMTFLTVKKNAH